MRFAENFDVIVVGGGHAGTEAALAAARMGCRTLLVTQSIESLGQMSCNPAVGGIGKGHLVREIDALGGAMARATDRAGIQFRTLNASKGPAVRATRAQADRLLYKRAIRGLLENQPNLSLFQQEVSDLRVEGDRVTGVVTQVGVGFAARAVVLTVGTFLGGRIHVGLDQYAGGRAGDPPSNRLAEKLRALPFRVGRLKTGTPPRIDGCTVDYAGLDVQHGDEPRPVFSFLGRRADHPRQVPCHITATNERTHEIIRAATDRSPMFTGVIEGVGPRYCPSVEDKVVRFAGRSSHQIFIEPEGLDTHEIYPNGISTSLPFDVQVEFVRSIRGFEQARITRPGYAIEYDFFDPRDLRPTLETRHLQGLYFAGQINGTTGYEEAAAQGLVAGANAALAVLGREPWWPRRGDAYIGVMIDDLITRGAPEPYRMFTSRAEYRLTLREDNADQRLTPAGRELGLVDDVRWRYFERKREAIEAELARLNAAWVRPGTEEAARAVALVGPLAREQRAFELLRRPELTYDAVAGIVGPGDGDWRDDERLAAQVALAVDVQAKYTGYIDRQHEEIERQRRHEETGLPADLDYAQVRGLSNEVRQRLLEHRPATLGQAARVPGVTPVAVSLLLVHLKRSAGGLAPDTARDTRPLRETLSDPRASTHHGIDIASPMNHIDRTWQAAVVAVLLLGLAACGGGDGKPQAGVQAPSTTASTMLTRGNGPEPDTLDPQKARTDGAFNILRDAFEGLTAVGPDGSAVPAAADSWDVSSDGLEYRFHLRDGLRWSNGDPLAAGDYVAGMRRLVDPATASPYAQILEPVVNADAITRGERPPADLGVSAPDDRTIAIRLRNPAPYLLGLLAQPGTFPVHGPSLATHGGAYAKPGNLVSNGAFVLADWVIGSQVELVRNRNYWNDRATSVERVRFVHQADPSAEFRLYRAGQLDVTYVVPQQQFGWIRENLPGELHISPQLSVYYYGFNLTRPPFKDRPGLRRALSLVIDRDRLATAVTGLGEAPAYGWVPRGVADYTPQQFDYASRSYAERVAEARELYRKAGYSDARPLAVEIRYNTGEVHNRLAVAVAAMWKDALGVKTTLYAEEFRALLQTIQARTETEVFRSSWVGDYNDAYSFLQLLQTGFGINLTGYSNPRYDALLAEATGQADPARRRALLEESERVMLADTPVLPLYFYVNKHLVKPSVHGWHDNVMNVQYSKDLSLGEAK